MSRVALSDLDGRTFDVAVIGAGINGVAAAHRLAAAGYSTLLVDKGDFASGTSGGSSRILHCGLRYLATGSSFAKILAHPARFATACRMSRLAMAARAEFVRDTPERAVPLTLCYPVYRDGPYAAWQLRAAFAILRLLGPAGRPLDFKVYKPEAARRALPFARWLGSPEKLRAVATYTEWQFEWPERIAMDAVLDAARLGAVARNYTRVTGLARDESKRLWRLGLTDTFDGASAQVSANVVLNTAGIWIDRVSQLANPDAPRKITGTKGIHVVMRLPPECARFGVTAFNRELWPYYCLPWRDLHYFGPTETLYEGDPDDVHATEIEIDGVIDEANRLLPGLAVSRENVMFTWSCVRPLTYDAALLPQGKRSREIHDLGPGGLPNVLAITAGPIMTHRSAGEEFLETVRRRVAPSGTPGPMSFAANMATNDGSPALLDHDPALTLAELRARAKTEQVTSLIDLLARRTRAGWSETMGFEAAELAAETVADILGWDAARQQAEANAYRAKLAHFNTLARDPREAPAVTARD
jgi:glycerol-3-phosphate dehydrogenase